MPRVLLPWILRGRPWSWLSGERIASSTPSPSNTPLSIFPPSPPLFPLSITSPSTTNNRSLRLRLADCPAPYPLGCEVHAGFLSAWTEVEHAVLTAVSAALDEHPHYDIVATGHSLGAAIATIAAASLREDSGYTDLYTYGSPRVGNAGFVEYVESLPGGNYRLTHSADPVPLLPPSVLGYRHMSPEYWLVGDSTRAEFGARNVTVCVGLLNFECNGGTLWTTISPLEHSYYFQRVSGCDDDGWGISWLEDKLPDGLSFGGLENVIKADREQAGKDMDD